ncbi:ERO1-like protein 2 [Yarrowia sp. C11]|nr:ERO1-like protein 2 [Yarrowia sp. E02]KAG5369250.1 ERO1-like protein 2 [Yarrowia sp. C11]
MKLLHLLPLAALLQPLVAQNVKVYEGDDHVHSARCLSGFIDDACGATFENVEATNAEVRPLLKELVKEDYFRYYKIDLNGERCPFVWDDGLCGNKACALNVESEEDLPEVWKPKRLGALTKDSVSRDKNVRQNERFAEFDLEQEYDSRGDNGGSNYCYPEDEFAHGGVYVSLLDNPERFTGYAGPHAQRVWRAVYAENCFTGMSSLPGEVYSPLNLGSGLVPFGQQDFDLAEIDSYANDLPHQCLEQRIFYRLLSGMQASISTHLCYEYLDMDAGEWRPNSTCFEQRVGTHRDRLSNLFFNYALVSRAVSKLNDHLNDIKFSDDAKHNEETRAMVSKLTGLLQNTTSAIFNETLVFSTPEAITLKSEFRQRFRNVSALMDCVGCDRCKLWGKVQTAGYGTALKLLFELGEDTDEVIKNLRRTELVALLNTFDRLSKSVEAVEYFESIKQGARQESPFATVLYYLRRATSLVSKFISGIKSNIFNRFRWIKDTIFWEDLERELYMTKVGLKLILKSYWDFPRNILIITFNWIAPKWDKFVGRDMYQDRVIPTHRGHTLTQTN